MQSITTDYDDPMSANQHQELPVAAMFVKGSGLNEQSLQLIFMERTAVSFVHIHITEYSVKGHAIVRKKGLNIYVIFSNKKQNIKIYLPI